MLGLNELELELVLLSLKLKELEQLLSLRYEEQGPQLGVALQAPVHRRGVDHEPEDGREEKKVATYSFGNI